MAVVGASAAGLRAAWAAAGAGARTLLLERREAVGVPESPALVAFDFLWSARFAPPAHAVRRRLEGVELVSPGGHALLVDAPLALLRRAELDAWLVKEAEQAGARVATGVRDLAMPARGVLVGEGLRVRARVVIFCDGARSLAHAHLAPVLRPDALTWGASLRVPAPGAPDARRVRIALGAHVRGGRAQLNPLDDAWMHWTFYRGLPEEAEARAREALARDARALGWKDGVVEAASFLGVAPDPVFTVPRQLAADGVLVAGGAAGQGGLEVGFAAGEAAGEHAARAALAGRASRTDFEPYERAWLARHAKGYRRLATHAERLARLDDAALDRLLAPWDGRRVGVDALAALASASPLRRFAGGARLARANPRALAPALGALLQARARPPQRRRG